MTLAEQRVVPSPGPSRLSPGGWGRLRDPRLAWFVLGILSRRLWTQVPL